MKIGITELIVVFIVALIALGPDKLPYYAKKLGEALAQFRKYSEAATKDIKESIVEPLEEAQRPLREAIEPLQELDRTVRGNVKEVEASLKGIGKPKNTARKAEEPAAEAETAKNAEELTAEPETVKNAEEPTAEPETVKKADEPTVEAETAKKAAVSAAEQEPAEQTEYKEEQA